MKSIMAIIKELIERAANSWSLKNTVGVNNHMWPMCFRICEFCKNLLNSKKDVIDKSILNSYNISDLDDYLMDIDTCSILFDILLIQTRT